MDEQLIRDIEELLAHPQPQLRRKTTTNMKDVKAHEKRVKKRDKDRQRQIENRNKKEKRKLGVRQEKQTLIANLREDSRYPMPPKLKKSSRPQPPAPGKPTPLEKSIRRHGLGPKVISVSLVELAQKHNGKCYYCGIEMTYAAGSEEPTDVTRDHKLARYHGGTDGMKNLVAACRDCNRLKSEMSVDMFKEWRQYLKDLYPFRIKGQPKPGTMTADFQREWKEAVSPWWTITTPDPPDPPESAG